ncbi:MAG TPA: carboxypeptidase regulatory-like domain-containing protein [Gemmatimonadaceae bacterium]|nr:carboxypeptidase regulatory-like domain-containing protein [Gemmatimonadaceae bacterium]
MRTTRQQITVAALSSVLLIAAAAKHAAAQTIRGKLIDQYTSQPIPGATVTLITPTNTSVGPTAKTGNDGSFSIQAPAPGIYRLRADLSGYISAMTPAIELGSGDEIDITWRLLAGDVQMRPVAIVGNNRRTSGRLSGFYDRAQRHGFGYFITSDQIQKMHPFSVSDLLRTVPGLEVLPSPRGFGNIVRTLDGCVPAVYLDGVRFPLLGESIDNIIDPSQLEGIEVYTHAAEVPAQFASARSNCGVIALWTKNF